MREKVNYGKITKLRLLISKKGITQAQLSQASAVEPYIISQLCSGKKTNIMLETAKRICFTLGCTLDEAFGDDE